MRKPSLFARLRYAFDNTLAAGTIALIGWLALASIALIVAIALIVRLAGLAPDDGFAQLVWKGLMRTLDAGTMGGDEGSWPYLFAMLAVTLGGIFIISALIGILTTGLEARIESMRKGRSKVIETGHTIILGWSEQIFSIVSELVVANANQRRSCIVILGDKDKVEMEDEIRQKVRSAGRTRIVCRSGSAIDLADLDVVSPQTAKSIIVLSPDGERPDEQVIKTLLALINAPNRRPESYSIVAAIRDPKNMDVAHLVGQDEARIVLVGDLIARIIAQTCRQSGLSTVYADLLDFAGSEFYFRTEPALVGKTFGEALSAYENAVVVGIQRRGSTPQLNPPMEMRLAHGDQLVIIAEDDDSTRLAGAPAGATKAAIQAGENPAPAAERILILGWNWRAPIVLAQLDAYVPAGSQALVVADDPRVGLDEDTRHQFRNLTCNVRQGDTTDREVLEGLEIASFDHVILLCYSDTLDVQMADARTLITLLHLRHLAERVGHRFSITSEMLDIRNRNLAEVTRADDFIVSDRLISVLLAQISENPALHGIFADLFNPEGAEVYLKPAGLYVKPDAPTNFYTVVEAARQRGESAFGYRATAHSKDKTRNYGVVINPKKTEAITFAEHDRIVVLAEK